VANIQSQIKRNRQNITRHERNKGVRSRLKTDLKRFRSAHESGDKAAADEAFRVASRSLDKAATRGIIHANNAANKKSRMARKLAAM
jgi:small subunit ribosomal protein S20